MRKRFARGSSAKRRMQWCGDGQVIIPDAGAPVAQIMQLCPTVGIDNAADVVHMVSHVAITTRRLTPATLQAFGVVVWKGKVLLGTSTPVQSHDYDSLDPFDYADEDIMLQRPLPVPDVSRVFDGNTFVVNPNLVTTQFVIKAKRKYNRRNHGIFLALGTDVSDVLSCFVQHRTLLSYT